MLGTRPEDLAISEIGLPFLIHVIEPLGPHLLLTGETDGKRIRVRPTPRSPRAPQSPSARTPAWRYDRGRPCHPRTKGPGGYTVPTDRLYPFQWNWNSAFVALGWATVDESRAFNKIERLHEGQWEDDIVPQIVFHAPSDDYFPGPDVWGISA